MLGLTSTRDWKQSKARSPFHKNYLLMQISDIEEIFQRSWRKTFYRGGPVFMSALAGLDIALWDLKGLYYR